MTLKESIRPAIKGIDEQKNSSFVEQFQNKTLRPILKLQNDLLIALFLRSVQRTKCDWTELNTIGKEKKMNVIFEKDNRFRSLIKGAVVGLFTLEEYESYKTEESELNKRIISMIRQRVQTGLLDH